MSDRKLTVLAIDEDSAALQTIQDYLEQTDGARFQFIGANSAGAGREEMERTPVDVVVLEYRLGAEDGLSFIEGALQSEGKDPPPFVMVTEHGDEQVAVKAIKLGASDYIPKNRLTPQTLQEAIQNALKTSDLRRQSEQHKRELERMAQFDGLTTLRNRYSFMDVFLHELKRAIRYQRSLSIMLLDLDHFKRVNDTYGHVTGDQLLSTFGAILKESLRETDVAGRVGGEEFCVLLVETPIEGAKNVAERLLKRASIETYIGPNGEKFHTTCSIGLAQLPGDSGPGDTVYRVDLRAALYKRADMALYRAKAAGRNCVRD